MNTETKKEYITPKVTVVTVGLANILTASRQFEEGDGEGTQDLEDVPECENVVFGAPRRGSWF